MAITNKDYIVFTLGALIGAGVAYFVTKRRIQKQCYEDYLQARSEEELDRLEASDRNKYVITDTNKKFSDYTDRLEEQREKAQKIASENGYIEEHADEPYIIDATDYVSTLDGYSSERINWYPSVNRATNETDDKDATDIAESYCGLDNIRMIEDSGDSYGYIRNDKKKADYEVYICYADWPLEEPGGVTD